MRGVVCGLGVFQASGDKAFLCPSWLFDFEISREFWANPHITVIYRWLVPVEFGRGGGKGRGQAKRPAKGRNSLKFQIYTRLAVIILILTPGREAYLFARPFRASIGGLICQPWARVKPRGGGGEGKEKRKERKKEGKGASSPKNERRRGRILDFDRYFLD